MAQRHVALYRRPVSAVARIPLLKHWKKSEINHWAVCVGDICYEVAQTDGPNGHNLLINTRADWIKTVQQKELEYVPANLGTCLTSWPDDEINACGECRISSFTTKCPALLTLYQQIIYGKAFSKRNINTSCGTAKSLPFGYCGVSSTT